jgi:hypothetical protein
MTIPFWDTYLSLVEARLTLVTAHHASKHHVKSLGRSAWIDPRARRWDLHVMCAGEIDGQGEAFPLPSHSV